MAKKWTTANIPDQTGRVALVTGANSGIGFETARVLAAKGAHVVLACRNEAKAEAARAGIKGDVSVLPLDLANLASVRDAAERFQSEHDRLDLLVNNAGIMAPPKRELTADGFESQFGTNHLGHFALTGLLLKMLLATDGSRVVTVSSSFHRRGQIRMEDLQAEDPYSGFGAYGQSKLANLLFTYRLQRMLFDGGSATIATAAHPGWTMTGLQRGPMRWAGVLLAQRPATGALPTLLAATGLNVSGGDYYGPRGLGGMRGHPKLVHSSDRSHDFEMADRLWAASEALTGVAYEIPAAG